MTLANLQPGTAPLPIEQTIHTFSYSGLFYLADRRSSLRPYGLVGAVRWVSGMGTSIGSP